MATTAVNTVREIVTFIEAGLVRNTEEMDRG